MADVHYFEAKSVIKTFPAVFRFKSFAFNSIRNFALTARQQDNSVPQFHQGGSSGVPAPILMAAIIVPTQYPRSSLHFKMFSYLHDELWV